MKTMPAFLFLMLFSVALGGCATVQPEPVVQTRVIDTSCSWVPKLSFSKDDTKDTKRGILEYEKARRTNCPEK